MNGWHGYKIGITKSNDYTNNATEKTEAQKRQDVFCSEL
jgi:hypothetical protein